MQNRTQAGLHQNLDSLVHIIPHTSTYKHIRTNIHAHLQPTRTHRGGRQSCCSHGLRKKRQRWWSPRRSKSTRRSKRLIQKHRWVGVHRLYCQPTILLCVYNHSRHAISPQFIQVIQYLYCTINYKMVRILQVVGHHNSSCGWTFLPQFIHSPQTTRW